MKVKMFLFTIILILLAPFAASAKQSSPLEKLDDISDEALQMVKYQRYEDAKRLLDYFSDQFTNASGEDRPFTMDELRIITVSHDQALEAVASTSMGYAERMNRITKFRLVMDAITTSHQPLWTEMEEPIMAAFSSLKEAAYNDNNTKFHESFNSFLSIYDVIYPSMKIDISADQIHQLDNHIEFIDGNRQKSVQATKQQEIEALGADMQKIFDQMKEDEADPSLWWVIISTGSIIIMTLSYVGFRKYKGDKEIEKNRSREFKD